MGGSPQIYSQNNSTFAIRGGPRHDWTQIQKMEHNYTFKRNGLAKYSTIITISFSQINTKMPDDWTTRSNQL